MSEVSDISAKALSRAKVIGGLGTGLAAVAVSPAAPQDRGSAKAYSSTAQPFMDPVKKYPAPPYPIRSPNNRGRD